MEKINHIEMEPVRNARGDVVGEQLPDLKTVINGLIDVINAMGDTVTETQNITNQILDMLDEEAKDHA